MTVGEDELLNSAESATDKKGERAAAACEQSRPDGFALDSLKAAKFHLT